MVLQIAVIGAGIVGAAISHQVARVGAKVRVFDVVTEPGQGGATRSTWSWINASKKHPQHYRDLNLAGLQRWKAEWAGLVHNCGSLVFDEDDNEPALSDPIYPARRLTAAQVNQLEPAISEEAASHGAHLYLQEAWVDPQAACGAMLAAAQEYGAGVGLGAGHRVERLVTAAEGPGGGSVVKGVVTADGTTHSADVVILAAGTATATLATQAGVTVPLLHKPAVIAVTRPLLRPTGSGAASSRRGSGSGDGGVDVGNDGRIVRHLLANPRVFAWQRPDGSFILGDTRGHEDGSTAWGESLLARATQLLPVLGEAGAEVERVEVAYRPWPEDGHPIIGPAPTCRNLYITTMHSGITLAPEVAHLVATEMAAWDVGKGAAVPGRGGGGKSDKAVREEVLHAAQRTLAPYRLDRDFTAGGRVAAYGWK